MYILLLCVYYVCVRIFARTVHTMLEASIVVAFLDIDKVEESSQTRLTKCLLDVSTVWLMAFLLFTHACLVVYARYTCITRVQCHMTVTHPVPTSSERSMLWV